MGICFRKKHENRLTKSSRNTLFRLRALPSGGNGQLRKALKNRHKSALLRRHCYHKQLPLPSDELLPQLWVPSRFASLQQEIKEAHILLHEDRTQMRAV